MMDSQDESGEPQKSLQSDNASDCRCLFNWQQGNSVANQERLRLTFFCVALRTFPCEYSILLSLQ